MSKETGMGKISREFFNSNILPKLGYEREEVLVPPRNGVDVGIVQTGPEKVMAITTDPFYIVPAYGWDKAAWFAFHIIASDLCTSGLTPEYMTVDLNLPTAITDEEIGKMWDTIHFEAKKYQVSIVAGHTARYEGTDYPMVGGATMIGTGHINSYVTSAMSQPGDAVVITKTIALEATSIFSQLFQNHIEKNLGEYNLKMGRKLFYKMSTVQESLEASRFGLRDHGITSMHDATEGGILGALHELAEASGNGIYIDKDQIPLYDEVKEITGLFGMDPFRSISEGTLVLTVKKDLAEEFVRVLIGNGIDATIVGEMKEKSFGRKLTSNGREENLVPPERDDFWVAISRAIEGKLD